MAANGLDEKLIPYLTQNINMVLGGMLQGETSYTNGFEVVSAEGGFVVVPRMPAGFLVDNKFYQAIFSISNAALYPLYTVLKVPTPFFVPMDTEDIHTARGLFFPVLKGIPKRLVITDLDGFSNALSGTKIPIMHNMFIDYAKTTSMAICGNSGSGKSYALTYFLSVLQSISDLIIVDPKFDTPSRWANAHNQEVIHPEQNRSKSDFLSQVNEALSRCIVTISERQQTLFIDPKAKFKPITVVIDEVLALSEGVNKSIKESFFSLLSQVALLGRATSVHLLLVSQRFDHTTIPVSVREQLNVLIQIGNINKKTTQFLFPDLDPEGIVIPLGKGTGLIQVIDDEHPYQVQPLLCPTYYTKGNVI